MDGQRYTTRHLNVTINNDLVVSGVGLERSRQTQPNMNSNIRDRVCRGVYRIQRMPSNLRATAARTEP